MNAVSLIRLIAGWLGDATNGINAQLDVIPYDGADTAPADLTVLEETTNLDTALGRLPEPTSRPCAQVYLSADGTETVDHQVSAIRDFDATVTVRLSLDQAASAAGARDLYYYVKATLESLRALHLTTEANKTRGSLVLTVPGGDGFRVSPVQAQLDDETLTAAITVRYTARDQA